MDKKKPTHDALMARALWAQGELLASGRLTSDRLHVYCPSEYWGGMAVEAASPNAIRIGDWEWDNMIDRINGSNT